jgi:hypothetical protein
VAKFSALKARLRLSVDKNGDVHYLDVILGTISGICS